eukprot:190392_1
MCSYDNNKTEQKSCELTPTSSILSSLSLSSSSSTIKSKKSNRKSPIPFKKEWQIKEDLSFIGPLRNSLGNSLESSKFTLNSTINASQNNSLLSLSKISSIKSHKSINEKKKCYIIDIKKVFNL